MRAVALVLVALLLSMPLAIALSGCGATPAQALNPRPVYGIRTDGEFGRCVYAGSWFGTAPGARTLLTAHACGRVEQGGAADAGAP